MKFTIVHPVEAHGYSRDLLHAEGMSRVAKAAEEFGFDAIAFTEHPAPSTRWLETGGHDSVDIMSALSFCAGQTERIKLMTYLLVVPYHHPLIAAKALTTLDLLSDGRVVAAVGTGYMRAEFLALGVDMSERNERFDEALEVMKGVWTQTPYSFEGKHFECRKVVAQPQPDRVGGPPILIGGNSALSRRRAALHQGWSPLMLPELQSTTRTPVLSQISQLATQAAEVREMAVEKQGEGTEMFIQVQTPQSGYLRDLTSYSIEEHRQHLGELEEAGVDSYVLQPTGDSVDLVVERLQYYAENFM